MILLFRFFLLQEKMRPLLAWLFQKTIGVLSCKHLWPESAKTFWGWNMFIQASTMQNHRILRWKLTSFILRVNPPRGVWWEASWRLRKVGVFVPPLFFFSLGLLKKSSSDKWHLQKDHYFIEKRPYILLICLFTQMCTTFMLYNSIGDPSYPFIFHTTSHWKGRFLWEKLMSLRSEAFLWLCSLGHL